LPTLYETLGQETTIAAVVATFYEKVLADAILAPYFVGVDMPKLRAHQTAFLVAATGGPKSYSGRDMAAAHAGLNITAAAFDRVAGHLVSTLAEAGVDSATIDAVAAAVVPLKDSIVTA
jgi:hemoglobin